MTLIGPKRIFGKGESREQNAIIKVYSAAELKKALTKVYRLPNGVGTIQIAGDITITEPIKLKQFVAGQSAPKEIIIQSVGGARIYNGNTSAGSYNYNQAGNTEIPLFDFGVCTTADKVTKYTFKDIIVNNDTSHPFGAFIGADLNGATYPSSFPQLCLITITNLKLHNVCNVYGVYDTTNTFDFASMIRCYSPRIEGLVFRNESALVPQFNLANVYFSPVYGLFSNISVWNPGQRSGVNDRFTINTNWGFVGNTFSAISALVDIIKDPRYSGYFPNDNGFANTITGCEIYTDFRDISFSFVNCTFGTDKSATLIPTKDPNGSCLVVYNNAAQTALDGTITDNNFVVKQTFTKYLQGEGNPISISVNHTNYNYEVNWYLSVRERSTGLCNTYHIKTNLKRGASGNAIIVSNTTVAASEEFFTLTGIIPVITPSGTLSFLEIAPNAGAGNLLDAACTVEIHGYKIFSNLI